MSAASGLVARRFAELEVGMSVEEELVWTRAELDAFTALSGDRAPVHEDDDFARSLGFEGTIAFGLLLAVPFSRILGCTLPGAFSVIQSLRLDFAQPVLPDERLRYRVTVTGLSASTSTAVLDLAIEDGGGQPRLRGKAQCSVLR